MSLKDYHKKRDFTKTQEPAGKLSYTSEHLFIIQKHVASHLHYDFRLELNGVLLSWAVPKGPCLDSTIKRLAVHVEDHPVAYGSFEGVIPKGEYGGGTVLLWDKGVWKPLDEHPTKAYKEGHLRFELLACKLHGRWDLFRFKDDKNWFLVKYEDEYARTLAEYDVVMQEPRSVITNQTIDEVAKDYEHIWSKKGVKNIANSSNSTLSQVSTSPLALLNNMKRISFPAAISPQLATLVDKAPEGEQWLHEIKFDGYRILCYIKNNAVTLRSRNQLDWTGTFSSLAQECKNIFSNNIILDGEVVLLDQNGRSDFQLLQNSIKANHKEPFIYYVFDILYYDEFDLKPLPLLQRKEILRHLLPANHSTILYSDHIINEGETMFQHACALSLEGIISKKLDSPYETRRSNSWCKIKCIQRQEFVIGGYTEPQGKRTHFGSLFLGVFNEHHELEYVGNVGTGFTHQSLHELYEQLQQHASKTNPFNSIPSGIRKAHWVKPVLIAEVEFSQWTKENHLRHSSFKGLRMDKKAKSIVREQAVLSEEVKEHKKKKPTKKSIDFKITHADKIIYPEDKIMKCDLLEYYDGVCDYILPFIKNRALSLVRCPEHYDACFFQRHYNKTTPKALKSINIESKGDVEPYIYLNDKEGLLSLVQMGVLEIHPWGSLITALETPDIIVIDLDPAPDVTWKTIVAAALDIKSELAQLQLQSFVKTTGGKGLHVVIPIQPEFEWDAIKNFTHIFVQYLEKKSPNRYISTMTKSKRGGKIFVDYFRNQRSATAIAAYSSRARIHAPVAVPLEWDELTTKRSDTAYTIKNVLQRLQDLKRDPWGDFWHIKQQLPLTDLQ